MKILASINASSFHFLDIIYSKCLETKALFQSLESASRFDDALARNINLETFPFASSKTTLFRDIPASRTKTSVSKKVHIRLNKQRADICMKYEFERNEEIYDRVEEAIVRGI